MQQRILSINAVVMSFMLACVVFGFFAIGVAAAAPVEPATGVWVNKDYKIKGEWSIEQKGDQQIILLSDQFKTKKGPDLKIFLSPKSIDSVTGANATDGAVLVSVLKSHKGAQEYVLPDGVDLNDFQAILIHCEAYSVLWGGTNI